MWSIHTLRSLALLPTVCVKFLEDMLGQKLPRRPQPGPGEQLTVFQFWSYVETLDSPSMEAYVTETAEEGEAVALITKCLTICVGLEIWMRT